MDLLKNLDNMITAEKFLHKKFIIIQNDELNKKIIDSMIEFAKLHTEAALKSASEKASTSYSEEPLLGEVYNINKESILNAYPLENIK